MAGQGDKEVGVVDKVKQNLGETHKTAEPGIMEKVKNTVYGKTDKDPGLIGKVQETFYSVAGTGDNTQKKPIQEKVKEAVGPKEPGVVEKTKDCLNNVGAGVNQQYQNLMAPKQPAGTVEKVKEAVVPKEPGVMDKAKDCINNVGATVNQQYQNLMAPKEPAASVDKVKDSVGYKKT